MQVITGDMDTIADAIADPEMRDLVQQRLLDIEPHSLSELGAIIVVEPGDSIAAIDRQLGFHILGNRWDGTRWGAPAFAPGW